VPRMLDDMLKVVLDPLFNGSLVGTGKEQQGASQSTSTFSVDGYSSSENMWNKIF
jgi:hypothetical protein